MKPVLLKPKLRKSLFHSYDLWMETAESGARMLRGITRTAEGYVYM